jgi:putative aldouronate transport system permease protein
MAKSRAIRVREGGLAFDVVLFVVMLAVTVVTLYPFINVLAISFNDSKDTVRGGITVFPRMFSLKNYEMIFTFGNIPHAFLISILRTVIGTLASLVACSMLAYTLNRKDFVARRALSRFLAVTLYVSGGMIPSFLLMRDLKLMNNFLVYILPAVVNAFYVFVIRSFMDGLPFELQESAKIDGANDLRIFIHIVLPLCTPVLATIALFVAVQQWNSWFDTYIYAGSNTDLSTLQFELMKILQSTMSGNEAAYGNDPLKMMNMISPEAIKMAIIIVTITPILVVYPFLQRYFMRGLTIGAVKG